MKIKCKQKQCHGHYKVRESQYGLFGGCSNFPRCKSTIKLTQLIFEFLIARGINVYRWKRNCYKCKQDTPVYSYFLYYELQELDERFGMVHGVGLGDIPWIDSQLSQEISNIKKRYSRTTKSYYMANTCTHCKALQGRNYVVDDPHEIMTDLFHNHSMSKYFFKNYTVTQKNSKLLADLNQLL